MTKKKKTKKNIQNIVQNKEQYIVKKRINIELIFSSIAMAVSIIAVFIAYSDHQLLSKQDEESKTAIWEGEFNSETEEFIFKSYSENIKLQSASIYFPSEINKHPVSIISPYFSFSTNGLELSIADYVERTIERKSDFILVSEGTIPIIVDSYYITGGKLFNIVSGYSITYTTVVSEDDTEPPVVDINGLLFSHHITDRENDLQDYIDGYWNQIH